MMLTKSIQNVSIRLSQPTRLSVPLLAPQVLPRPTAILHASRCNSTNRNDDPSLADAKPKVSDAIKTAATEAKEDDQPPSNYFSKVSTSIQDKWQGLLLAGVVMQGGYLTADVLGKFLLEAQGVTDNVASPISGIPCAILLGLGINNLATLPESTRSGLAFATKPVLQAGVICVGAKLSAFDLVTTGLVGIPAVAASVTAGMTFIPWFAEKVGLPHRMGALIAAGTSICGVTAITALSPAIKATKQESGFAIANVVAFGTIGMLTYPYIAPHLFASSHQIGMFLGLAVHDTSQVIGSALTYSTLHGDEEVLRVAAITKLTRNICLAGVIPALTWSTMRKDAQLLNKGQGNAVAESPKGFEFPGPNEIKKYIPGFIFGFLGMSVARTLGDMSLAQTGAAFGLLEADQWESTTKLIGSTIGSKYLLGTAMAGVGLSTSTSAFKGVGPMPFVVGATGALVVGATGLVATTVVGSFL